MVVSFPARSPDETGQESAEAGTGNEVGMDTSALAEELRRRRAAAARRASHARQRIEALRGHAGDKRGRDFAGRELERAQARAEAAHRDAQLTHKQSADLHEQRARDLRRVGADDAARHAEERADSERENAAIEADRLGEARDGDG
jgi:hypothetical protein